MIERTRYDRAAAAQVLTEALAPALAALRSVDDPPPWTADPQLTPLVPDPGSHLTAIQLDYLRTEMRPCSPELVRSATHKVLWSDSDGIVNVAHTGALGAVVPMVARETTLVLRRALAADAQVRAAVTGLTADQRGTLAATTTDRDPLTILEVGLETTARALVQHAYLADQMPYRDAAELARGLRDSGIFAVVANTWFWGLQSSTFRRGMIPVSLVARPDGVVRYSLDSVAILRAMKDATIASPTADEGVARQYGPLPAGEQPRCLANMPTTVGGHRITILPEVVEAFVTTFVRLLELVRVAGPPEPEKESPMSAADEVFEVPDMTCSHCTNTVTKVLEANGVTVTQIDLDTKKVIAAFPSPAVRDLCFDAIRNRGYTVIPPVAS